MGRTSGTAPAFTMSTRVGTPEAVNITALMHTNQVIPGTMHTLPGRQIFASLR
jgi:hypothetical protein